MPAARRRRCETSFRTPPSTSTTTLSDQTGGRLDRVVFGVTAVVAISFLIWGFVSTASLANVSGTSLTWTMANTGWLFVITSSAFVVFVLWLAMSRFGTITLGRDDEEPEFRTVSWVAMMFSAGMGIGLMFYGVSEPVSHFVNPPPGTGEAGNPEAVQHAMATTLFHWTLHPWAIYAVVGLAIAYGVYRKGRLQLISAAFEPLIGHHAHGRWGKLIDILAIFATLFGSAASLGLGALQIRSGLQIVSGIGTLGNAALVAIIAAADRRVRDLGRHRCGQGDPVALEHQHGARGASWPSSSSSSARPSSSST